MEGLVHSLKDASLETNIGPSDDRFACRVFLPSTYEINDCISVDYTSPAAGGKKKDVQTQSCLHIFTLLIVNEPGGVRLPANGIIHHETKRDMARALQNSLQGTSFDGELPLRAWPAPHSATTQHCMPSLVSCEATSELHALFAQASVNKKRMAGTKLQILEAPE
jgi:hypothetical protein